LPTHPRKELALPPLHSLGPPMGGLANVLLLFISVFSLFLASCKKTFSASRLHSAHLITDLFQLLVPGGVPCFPPPRFSFFPFSRVVGGNALRAKRQEQNTIGQSGGNWPILASNLLKSQTKKLSEVHFTNTSL